MLLNCTQYNNVNIYFLNSFAYILLLLFFLKSIKSYNNYYHSNSDSFMLLLLAGLPPSPIFFTKIWLFGSLVSKISLAAVILLVSINSALLSSYINFIFLKKNKKIIKNRYTYKNNVILFYPVFSSMIFILNPLLFKII